MTKHWYVSQSAGDGVITRLGPLSADELLQKIAQGEIAREARVCETGDAAWRSVLDVASLAAAFAPHPQNAPSVPPVAVPLGASIPPLAARKSRLLLWVGAAAVALALIGVGVFALTHRGGSTAAARAIDTEAGAVRVVMKSRTGTGFFVAGPDDLAYVATAYHVVETGEPILIERNIDVPGGRGQHYVEAYPEAEVVAFDADADLAIVRINNVRADHFTALPLAREPMKDEEVLSYGFPHSNLAKRFGMVSKPGKILSLSKFPAYDRRTGEVIRNEAVDGLLVSAEIEPGFSGGPTCNARGEVVGVSVTKDSVHRAQNGAVSVLALRQLLAQVRPQKDEREPTPDEVKALLTRIEREYLLLPIDRRWSAREYDFLSTGDLPRLDELITTLRKLENDTTRDADTKLSGQAMLGMVLLRLPGRPLETYLARSTRHELANCELREGGLKDFFGGLVPRSSADRAALAQTARARCSALAFRPLAWDMTALALQWEGKEREIAISKVETVDAERHIYRAAARVSGLDHLVDVWLATDGGPLRLKLFDKDGRPAGLSLARTVPTSSFQGTWRRSEPRTAKNFGKDIDADTDTDETLVVSVATDSSVTVTHQVRRHVYLKARAARFACGGSTLDLGIEQTFAGTLDNGSVVASRQKDARSIGADMARCWSFFTYASDQVAVLKSEGQKLLMVRTDGISFPETAEFERVATAP